MDKRRMENKGNKGIYHGRTARHYASDAEAAAAMEQFYKDKAARDERIAKGRTPAKAPISVRDDLLRAEAKKKKKTAAKKEEKPIINKESEAAKCPVKS